MAKVVPAQTHFTLYTALYRFLHVKVLELGRKAVAPRVHAFHDSFALPSYFWFGGDHSTCEHVVSWHAEWLEVLKSSPIIVRHCCTIMFLQPWFCRGACVAKKLASLKLAVFRMHTLACRSSRKFGQSISLPRFREYTTLLCCVDVGSGVPKCPDFWPDFISSFESALWRDVLNLCTWYFTFVLCGVNWSVATCDENHSSWLRQAFDSPLSAISCSVICDCHSSSCKNLGAEVHIAWVSLPSKW